MKIVIISVHSLALNYLRDSFDDSQLKRVTLITDKLTHDIKEFLKIKKIKYLVTKNLTLKTLEQINFKNSFILSAG
mgnify:FL=1